MVGDVAIITCLQFDSMDELRGGGTRLRRRGDSSAEGAAVGGRGETCIDVETCFLILLAESDRNRFRIKKCLRNAFHLGNNRWTVLQYKLDDKVRSCMALHVCTYLCMYL